MLASPSASASARGARKMGGVGSEARNLPLLLGTASKLMHVAQDAVRIARVFLFC